MNKLIKKSIIIFTFFILFALFSTTLFATTDLNNSTNNIANDDMISILINWGITIFVYCIVPTIMRFSHGIYENKKAIKISLINSIIIGFIFILIKSNQQITTTSGASVLYFFVNELILTYNFQNKHDTSDESRTDIECKVCGKITPYNEYGTCKECHEKILKRLQEKGKIK